MASKDQQRSGSSKDRSADMGRRGGPQDNDANRKSSPSRSSDNDTSRSSGGRGSQDDSNESGRNTGGRGMQDDDKRQSNTGR